MLRYDTILWDLDGTLLDFKLSEKYALGVCLKEYGISMTEEMRALYSGINDIYWERLERGEITKKELLPGRFQEFFRQMGWNGLDPVEMQKKYEKELGVMTYYRDNSYEIVQRLKELGIRQHIVTNGIVFTQKVKMKNSGFDKLIEKVFISDEIGYEKPSPAFFERAFAQLGSLEKEKMLLVGDSLTSDMKGANNAGIDACWYNPNGKQRPDSKREEISEKISLSERKEVKGKPEKEKDIHIEYEIRHLDEIFQIIGL